MTVCNCSLSGSQGRGGKGAIRALSKWIFFAAVFFPQFTNNFSSFFSVLIFLPGGFSSLLPLFFGTVVLLVWEPNENSEGSMQMSELQGTFSS